MLANPTGRENDRRIHLLYAHRPLAAYSWTLVKNMVRNFSNMCFALALSIALLMNSFAVQDELVWLAVLSVFVSAILTNLMWIRSMGIAGIGGLSIVYIELGSGSLPGTILTVITTLLLVIAVFLAIYADLSYPSKNIQGDEKQHEI